MFIISNNGETLFFNEQRQVWTDHPNVYFSNSVYHTNESKLPEGQNGCLPGTLYRFLAPLNGVVTTDLLTHASWLTEGCSDKTQKILGLPIGKLKFNRNFIKNRCSVRPLNWQPKDSLNKFHLIE